jgi:predicted amidohydrolase YtcJ
VLRLAELGVPCVVQPQFVTTFGEGIRRAIGDERSNWSHRGKSFLEAGVPLGLSSDRPVAPGAPLAGIQSFVQRITEDGLPYGPKEKLTVAEAIRAATIGSAEVTGLQSRKGRLIPGQLADMVFLGSHPEDVAVEDIHAIPVLATLAGGWVTHAADGFYSPVRASASTSMTTGAP